MKCDELKRHRPDIMVVGEGKAMAVMPEDPMGVWCHIQDVHDLLAEKDKEIESLKAAHYAESVDAGMRERRLRRALWLARAERASDKALIFYFAMAESYLLNINGYSDEEKGHTRMRNAIWWRTTWLKVERKCRAKAEEYK